MFCILFPSIFAGCFQVVDINHFGLLYDTFSETIIDQGPGVVDGGFPTGRYMYGTMKVMREFPVSVISRSYITSTGRAIDGASITGQKVHLDVSVQFRLNQKKIRSTIFPEFGVPFGNRQSCNKVENTVRCELPKLLNFFDNTIISVAKNTVAQFTTGDFYDKRRLIRAKIEEEVTKVLEPRGIIIFAFQLRQVTLSAPVDAQITQNAVTWQSRKTAEFEQLTRSAQSLIKVISSTAEADASVIIMNSTAAGYKKYEYTKSDMLLAQTQAETDSYRDIQAAITSDGNALTDRQLLYYQWLDAWRNAPADALVIDGSDNVKLTT